MLTQSFVQTFLSTAFGMSTSYIVPKQGNWYSVQDSMPEGAKVDTWCAYKIKDSSPDTHVFYDQLTDGSGNISSTVMKSTVELQLVGSSAEYGVQSMSHWPHRGDLLTLLTSGSMAIMPYGLGDYYVADFRQEGDNAVLSFNSQFEIVWMSEINTSQQILTTINLPSGYTQVLSSGILTIKV